MKWHSYDIRNMSEEDFQKYYLLMSTQKQNRVNRLRNESDRKRTVAGEMLTRKAISEWCGVSKEKIQFSVDSYGKPFAVNLSVEFNISHSHDMVVCAVDDSPVGIDIEKIRNVDLNMCKHICTQKEIDYIYENDKDSIIRFFEVWTLKEAYIKNIGKGMQIPLNTFNVLNEDFKCKADTYYINDYVVSVFRNK